MFKTTPHLLLKSSIVKRRNDIPLLWYLTMRMSLLFSFVLVCCIFALLKTNNYKVFSLSAQNQHFIFCFKTADENQKVKGGLLVLQS